MGEAGDWWAILPFPIHQNPLPFEKHDSIIIYIYIYIYKQIISISISHWKCYICTSTTHIWLAITVFLVQTHQKTNILIGSDKWQLTHSVISYGTALRLYIPPQKSKSSVIFIICYKIFQNWFPHQFTSTSLALSCVSKASNHLITYLTVEDKLKRKRNLIK
jgi:hypothetical protein